MRRFILHTFDKSRSFNLNANSALATEPSGLGNAFSLSYKESEKGKHLVNVTPDFEPITLTVYFNADGTDGYVNYKSLLTFLMACGKRAFLFEYDDGVTNKFCDVVIKSLPKSEVNEEGVFVETFTFERQTYWYEEVAESFSLKNTDESTTKFPLRFPFGFVGRVLQQKYKITNNFFVDAPISVKVSGNIAANIYLYIATTADEVVAAIQLSTGNTDGTTIVIEPSTKKITVTTDGVSSNGYGLTDKTQQSFLYLPQGEYYIGSNIRDTDTGKIEISIKRYLFD